MLAPRASNAFVCIRCELQHARRRLPVYSRRTSHASFSASAHRRNGAEELEALSPVPTEGVKIIKEVKPLDRIRKRKGKVIRETSARLGGIKSLGDDAEILVLSEVANDKSAEASVEPEPMEPVVVPDILASLQQENDALTPEDIQDRLESLRPQFHAEPDLAHYVSLKTFVELIHNLTNSFTQQQLSRYYSTAKNVQQAVVHKEILASLKGETGSIKHPITRTDWHPFTTPIAKRLPGADVSTRNKRTPVSKQLLVDRIIRDVWKLVPLEEVEAPGEIELSLRPWQIQMLSAGDAETLLGKICQTRRAKIEIYQQHNILRITADKTTAEYAADDIEEALRSFVSRKLQLKPWISCLEKSKVPQDEKVAALYTDEDFHLVNSLTRAVVQRMDNSNTLVLRALDETALAEAERMLIRLLPLKDPALRTSNIRKLDPGKGAGHLLPTSYDERSLDLKHRSATLGRWSCPVARQSHAEVDEAQAAEHAKTGASTAYRKHAASIVQSLRQAADQDSRPVIEQADEKTNIWLPPEFKLSAELGQALFPLDDRSISSRLKDNKGIKDTAVSSLQPLFTSNVSGSTRFLGSAHLSGTTSSPHFEAVSRTEKPLLQYDFVAAPGQLNLEAGQSLPSLHIQMRSSRTGNQASLHKLTIRFREHFHTVLLPERAADLQFVRDGRLRLRQSQEDKSVNEWIKTVRANITSGGRLSAPDLTISIPKWTFSAQPADAKGMQKVTYLFSGVRFRQVISGLWQGTPASYSTTQSGKVDAQGSSLSLYYPETKANVETLLESDDKLTSFVEQSLGFVDQLTEAATQIQPIAKMLRARHTEGGRKQRRLEEQTAVVTETDDAVDTEKVDAISDESAEDIMQLLDDAVEQSQMQVPSLDGTRTDDTDIHDTFLGEESSKPADGEASTADEEGNAHSSDKTASINPDGSLPNATDRGKRSGN